MKIVRDSVVVILAGVLILAIFNNSNAQISFVDVQSKIGLDFPHGTNTSTWGDVDHDGDIDVYCATEGGGYLFFNDLDVSGKFVIADTTVMPIVLGSPRAVIMGDVDNDGDLDIVDSRTYTKVYLLINQLAETGSLRFVDIADKVDMSGPLNMNFYSATMADYNNDTLLDIMITEAEGLWETRLFKNRGVVAG